MTVYERVCLWMMKMDEFGLSNVTPLNFKAGDAVMHVKAYKIMMHTHQGTEYLHEHAKPGYWKKYN